MQGFSQRFLLTALLALVTAIAGCASQQTASDEATAAAVDDAGSRADASHDGPKPAATDKLLDLPYIQRELDNGLKVIVVKAPFPGTVSVQIPLQTGSRNEIEPGKTGFAHFFEHMMFRGTPKYPADAYGAVIKNAGADQNAYTDDDLTNYYTNFTTEDLPKILEVEADRFQNLSYSEEQFRTEALAVKGEYLKNYSNPLLKGIERLQDLAYSTHTYKHTTMGFLKDIEDMPNQGEYAKEFFSRWYRPEYASVVIVGDVELEPTFELVKQHFGSWQRGSYKADVPQEPPPTGPKYEHLKFDGPTLPWLILGFRGPAFAADSVDAQALGIAGEVYFGETSAVYQDLVVKRQLADQFFYQSPTNKDPGLFLVALRLTKPENAEPALRAIEDAMVASRVDLIPKQKLADTKSRLKYSFANGMNSAASIGGIVARYVSYERDFETLNRAFATFDRVSAEDVRDAAARVFVDAGRTAVSISNDAALAGASNFRALDTLAQREPIVVADDAKVAEAADEPANPFAANQGGLIMRPVTMPSDSPLVDVVWLFKGGAADDPPGKRGLAALTASMIAEGGSAARTFEQLQQAYYPLAANLSASVDKDMVTFSGTVHRDNFDRWYRIASEQLYDPGFRQEDLDRLKQQQVNAVRVSLRSNNDEELGKEALYETVYGETHPYGTLSLGHAKDIESITLDDVRMFYRERFTAPRLILGAAGGYSDAQRNRLHADVLRLRRVTTDSTQIPPAPSTNARTALVIEKEAPAVAVSFGFPHTLKRGDPDWLALYLVRSWLGEHRNSSAQLYNKIREQRGMNYGDYAYIEYFPYGMFAMQPPPNFVRQNDLFQVWLRPLRNNNDAMFATRMALSELDRLKKDGMAAADFESTRAFLKKQVAVLTASQSRALGYAMDAEYLGMPSFNEYVRNGMDALTLEQVNAAIRRHFALDQIRFVFVTKEGADLVSKLKSGAASPVEYNTEKPASITDEDKVVSKYPIGVKAGDVKLIKGEALFE